MAHTANLPEPDALLARLAAAQDALGRGDFCGGLELAEALNEEALAIDAWRVAAEAALVVAKIQCNRLVHAEVERWCERAMAASRLAGTEHPETVAWVVLASSRAWGSQPGPALHAIDMALARIQDDVPSEVRRAVFTGIAMAYDTMGMPAPGLAAARQALAAVGPVDPVAVRSRVRVNVLYSVLSMAEWQGRVSPAVATKLLVDELPQLPVLEAECAEVGTSHARASYCHAAGQILARLGRLPPARALLEELTELAYDAHDSIKRNVFITLAGVQRALHDEAAAQVSLSRAQALVDAARSVAPAVGELSWLAQLAELQGDWPRAVALLKHHHVMDRSRLLAAFDARVAELTAQVAQQSLRLENADLRQRNAGLTATYHRWRDLAHTDPLTQLVNRRGLERVFDALSAQGQRLSLAMLDLDHFKHINDHHSHVVGDEVLRKAAGLMQQQLREPDLLARYGGEEFTLLLVDAPCGASTHAVERLRHAVAGFDWRDLGLAHGVTLSAGVVEVRTGESLLSAVKRADAYLYMAKQAGRDRVFHQPATT